MSNLSRSLRAGLIAIAALVLVVVAAYVIISGRGFDARESPGRIETAVATRLRSLAIPGDAKNRTNPAPASDEGFDEALGHFADHCAVCHGNDGSGQTDFGRGLYPKPPDLRLPATQKLTDGELFYIIEHGVPLTGMPGFGFGGHDGEAESWRLVHFIRRMPSLTEAELARMADLNPMSPAELRQRMAEEEFLRGGDAPAPVPTHKHSGGSQ